MLLLKVPQDKKHSKIKIIKCVSTFLMPYPIWGCGFRTWNGIFFFSFLSFHVYLTIVLSTFNQAKLVPALGIHLNFDPLT